jgi:formylglycine-generating enzyme required for sulfatase activity
MTERRVGLVAILVAPLVLAMQQPPTRDAFVEPLTGMRFVELPAGTFEMGSRDGEAQRQPDEIAHRVTIPDPFLLGRFEVTQEEWTRVMGTFRSHFSGCPRCPVERINFLEIGQFLERLNARGGPWRFRLPTEAEWEHACRAGTATPFHTGAALSPDAANYDARFPYNAPQVSAPAPRGTVPVGSYDPNGWGLYDMHGNVWEWVSDWYGPYAGGGQVDPHGPPAGDKRVIRGGSWYFDANSARCALRYTHRPQDRGFSLGFRVAASPAR